MVKLKSIKCLFRANERAKFSSYLNSVRSISIFSWSWMMSKKDVYFNYTHAIFKFKHYWIIKLNELKYFHCDRKWTSRRDHSSFSAWTECGFNSVYNFFLRIFFLLFSSQECLDNDSCLVDEYLSVYFFSHLFVKRETCGGGG